MFIERLKLVELTEELLHATLFEAMGEVRRLCQRKLSIVHLQPQNGYQTRSQCLIYGTFKDPANVLQQVQNAEVRGIRVPHTRLECEINTIHVNRWNN